MTLNEIFKLIDAGFSKADILTLAGSQQTDPKPDPKPEPKPEPKEDPKPEPKPDPKPEPQETETDKLVKALGLQVEGLTKALQASNIRNTEHNGQEESVDDILAKIINPNNGGES